MLACPSSQPCHPPDTPGCRTPLSSHGSSSIFSTSPPELLKPAVSSCSSITYKKRRAAWCHLLRVHFSSSSVSIGHNCWGGLVSCMGQAHASSIT